MEDKRSWFIDDSAVHSAHPHCRVEHSKKCRLDCNHGRFFNRASNLDPEYSLYTERTQVLRESTETHQEFKTPVTRMRFYRAPFKHYWYLPYQTIIFASAGYRTNILEFRNEVTRLFK